MSVSKYLDNKRETTFLFINSLGTDFRIWDGVVSDLKHYGNILRFDKQGHGLSSLSPKTQTIADYAQDVLGLMDALNIEKVVLIGLSIGGVIGQYLAVYHANRLEKLILSHTAPKIGTDEGWNARINQVKTNGIASITEGVMRVWFSENFHQNRPNELQGYKTMLANSNTEGYVRACEVLKNNDLRAEIGTISTPTLCFAGSADGSTPPDLVKSMADAILNASYILIDGVGHIPCVEVPHTIFKHIVEFTFYAEAKTLYERGMITRRAVLGNAHVNRAEANKSDFDTDFQEYITNSAWGAVAQCCAKRQAKHIDCGTQRSGWTRFLSFQYQNARRRGDGVFLVLIFVLGCRDAMHRVSTFMRHYVYQFSKKSIFHNNKIPLSILSY